MNLGVIDEIKTGGPGFSKEPNKAGLDRRNQKAGSDPVLAQRGAGSISSGMKMKEWLWCMA